MSAQELLRLAAEAQVLAGGMHQCEVLGHSWRQQGGRACRHSDDGCSMPAYQCSSCGEWDYGEAGGPGDVACLDHCRNRGLP